MKPRPDIKPLHKLNREFMLDMLSDNQNKNTETVDNIKVENEIENTTPIKTMEFIKPIVIEIEPPQKVNNKINLEEIYKYNYVPQPDKKTKKLQKKQKPVKKRGVFSLISDILFYLAILTVMFAILTSGTKDGSPRTFMGKYSYFTVVSPSMQDELPVGSFILVKKTDAYELQIGDNITFMRDANTNVTHKIADIYENYNDSGARGFQTKGTNNAEPDKEIVYDANVVGKVIFSIPKAGAVISVLRANIYIIFIIFGVFLIAAFVLRWLFTQMQTPDTPEDFKT
jgi:signal peptidase